MKYLKLQISTQEQGLLYEKDVDVQSAFESFIRFIVSTMLEEGAIYPCEHYSAVIIPRYEPYIESKGLQLFDREKVNEEIEWLELQFEYPVQPDKPVSYFTVEIRIKERYLIYRYDFQVNEVAYYYVTYGIAQALIGLGVLGHDETYWINFFALDDQNSEFDKESIPPLEKKASNLIEFTDEQPVISPFQYRDPILYGKTQVINTVKDNDIRIFIKRSTIDQLDVEAVQSVEKECGGILVGNVYESTDRGRKIVEISDIIVSQNTLSSIFDLKYTFKSWLGHNTLMREKFQGKRIVGWFHTHLTQCTNLFFSQSDLFLHKQFFPEEWYVALVMDNSGNRLFFQWKDDEVVVCEGYHIFENIGVVN